jgi:hypothetical protein
MKRRPPPPPNRTYKWPFPCRRFPTHLLCSMSDYPTLHVERDMHYRTYLCNHWAFGIVLYEPSRFISNTRNGLMHEWRDLTEHETRARTIKSLSAKYGCGFVYRIKKRILFETPVTVRAAKRNYGDGWIKPEDLELRSAIRLPAWTRVPASVRKIMASDRGGGR